MSERKKYFIKQKIYGAIIVLIGILPIILHGDGSAAIITTPIGLYLMISKKMCIMDDYYHRVQMRRRRKSH